MAALSTIHPTLLDVAKRQDPNGQIATIVEMLHETNEILQDMVWAEGNLETGHRTTIRTGLPAPTWRKLYGGVQPTKSTTVQVTETCGMLEAYAEIDKALADLNGNTAAFRMTEDAAHLEGMSQEFSDSLFYANEATAPEEITGFAPRFNSRTAATAQTADNVIHGGSTTDNVNTSIWLIGWGSNTVHGITPKGMPTGWQMNDKGQVTVENIDGSGGRMEAYRTHYQWHCGLSVRDWRYVVRIANIQPSAFHKAASSGPDVVDLMTQALELVPSLGAVKPAFYMNRGARSALRRQIKNSNNVQISMEEVAGKHVMFFDGVPVRRSDSILNTEALVTT